MSRPMSDRDFVEGLARGLAVIRAFREEQPEMTLAEVAAATDLSAAAARRYLYTLRRLGYVASFGRRFVLRPKVLEIGSAYWGSMRLEQVAQGHLRELSEKVEDNATLAVIDGDEVLFVAHSAHTPNGRLRGIGARLPVWSSSHGRAIIAYLPDERIEQLLELPRKRFTKETIVEPDKLRDVLAMVRKLGFALIEDELEYGISAVAVPIFVDNNAVAALSCSSSVKRQSELMNSALEPLQEAARQISDEIRHSSALRQSLLSMSHW